MPKYKFKRVLRIVRVFTVDCEDGFTAQIKAEVGPTSQLEEKEGVELMGVEESEETIFVGEVDGDS